MLFCQYVLNKGGRVYCYKKTVPISDLVRVNTTCLLFKKESIMAKRILSLVPLRDIHLFVVYYINSKRRNPEIRFSTDSRKLLSMLKNTYYLNLLKNVGIVTI